MNKNLYNKLVTIVMASAIAMGALLTPVAATAQIGAPECVPGSIQNCEGTTDVKGVIQTIIQWALIFAGSIAVLFLIWGGFRYMTASGNDEQAAKGRKTVINALIGLAIIILSYVIVTLLINFLGNFN